MLNKSSNSNLVLVSVFFLFRWVLTLVLLVLNVEIIGNILSTEHFPFKAFTFLIIATIFRFLNNSFIDKSVKLLKKEGDFEKVIKIAPVLADTFFIMVIIFGLMFINSNLSYLLLFYALTAFLYPYVTQSVKYFNYLYVGFYLSLLIALHLNKSDSVETALISLIMISICFLPLRGLLQWKTILTPIHQTTANF